jgi:hypothetical protein
MSYWIYLDDEAGVPVPVQHFIEGGTLNIFGSSEAEVNVTYNYARHFDFRSLHQRHASETVAELEAAVARLGTERDGDYWSPTEGNAGAACELLLGWAKQHPTAIWRVS